MKDLGRPPAGIAAPEFFERWLPEAYAAAGCEAPADPPRVRVTLSGAGGGDWHVLVGGEGLSIAAADPSPRTREPAPEVWLRQSAADFLAAFSSDPDLPELLPPGWGPLDLLFLDPRDVTLVRQIGGRFLVEVLGKRRRRWALDISLGKAGIAAGRARATVRIDGATYDGLRKGSLPPLQALLEGKIAVEGDRALSMQALMLLGTRLSRV
jgi:hypothetical protein